MFTAARAPDTVVMLILLTLDVFVERVADPAAVFAIPASDATLDLTVSVVPEATEVVKSISPLTITSLDSSNSTAEPISVVQSCSRAVSSRVAVELSTAPKPNLMSSPVWLVMIKLLPAS